VDQEAVMDENEWRELLLEALGLLRKEWMVRMGGMAIDQEIERAWQNYLKTTPELVRIMRALG
jgi:hypothetical protein